MFVKLLHAIFILAHFTGLMVHFHQNKLIIKFRIYISHPLIVLKLIFY